MRRFVSFVSTLCFIAFFANASYAGVTVIQALEFGSWISKNNTSQHEITINTNGTYSFDAAGFIEITAPQEGIFDLDGMASNATIISVTVTQRSPLSASGPDFEMINFQQTHPVTTDGSGVARITVGATAQASGAGGSYADNTFNGQVDIVINF